MHANSDQYERPVLEHPRPIAAKVATIRAVIGEKKIGTFDGDRLLSVAMYTLAALFVGLVLLIPFYLLVRSGGAWRATIDTLRQPVTLHTLGNTVLLTISVTIFASMLAIPLAWLTTRTDLPGRKLWTILHSLPLVMPSYIYAFLFLSFLSPRGLLQQALAWLGIERLPSIYGFPGAFIVLSLIGYPYIFLTVRAALRQMDTDLLEAAQVDGASKRDLLRHVLLPYLWPSITSGGLLVALYCLRDFGAVTLLQYSTFTRVIYNRYQGLRLEEAATLAAVLVLLTGFILWAEGRWRSAEIDSPDTIADTLLTTRIKLKHWRWPALLFTAGVSLLSLIMPTCILIYWFVRGLRQDWLISAIGDDRSNTANLIDVFGPAQTSVLTALLAAVVGLIFATPIALLATRNNGWWARFFERISYASYALPGIVVALAFVYIGINYVRPLYQTLPMLIAAYMVLFVPQAISAERSILTRIPVELEEVGYNLGGTRWDILRYVTLPLMRPGIAAGGLLIFLTVMKELPATLILSPIGYRSLSSLIWSNLSEAFFARAAIPTLLLLFLSSLPLAYLTFRDRE